MATTAEEATVVDAAAGVRLSGIVVAGVAVDEAAIETGTEIGMTMMTGTVAGVVGAGVSTAEVGMTGMVAADEAVAGDRRLGRGVALEDHQCVRRSAVVE